MKKDLNSLVFTLIITSTFIVLSGCGPQFVSMKVGYDLQNNLKTSIPNADKVNLYVERFSDVREGKEKNLIGEAKTGVFNESTPIIIDDGVEEFSTKTLRKAFSEAGFNIIANKEEADLIFKGRINKFWLQEFATGYSPEHSEADVEFDVVLIDRVNNRNIWYDVKKSHVKSKTTILDATAYNEETMNKALNEVIISIIKDRELMLAINKFIRTMD